jgi:hypothetical protein
MRAEPKRDERENRDVQTKTAEKDIHFVRVLDLGRFVFSGSSVLLDVCVHTNHER